MACSVDREENLTLRTILRLLLVFFFPDDIDKFATVYNVGLSFCGVLWVAKKKSDTEK